MQSYLKKYLKKPKKKKNASFLIKDLDSPDFKKDSNTVLNEQHNDKIPSLNYQSESTATIPFNDGSGWVSFPTKNQSSNRNIKIKRHDSDASDDYNFSDSEAFENSDNNAELNGDQINNDNLAIKQSDTDNLNINGDDINSNKTKIKSPKIFGSKNGFKNKSKSVKVKDFLEEKGQKMIKFKKDANENDQSDSDDEELVIHSRIQNDQKDIILKSEQNLIKKDKNNGHNNQNLSKNGQNNDQNLSKMAQNSSNICKSNLMQKLEEDDDFKGVEWGKGFVQLKEKQRLEREEKDELKKSFARSKEDENLNKFYKAAKRWGDPMMGKKTKSKKKKRKKNKKKKPKRPRSEFSFANRYGILPGYRWDGVDRSNGWEAERAVILNEQKNDSIKRYKMMSSSM